MTYNERVENAKHYVMDRLPQEELLAQLAEEAAELAHAALKLRRVLDGTNPTPVDYPTAVSSILEEVADVQLLIYLLDLERNPDEIVETMDRKLLRWQSRLIEAEQ